MMTPKRPVFPGRSELEVSDIFLSSHGFGTAASIQATEAQQILVVSQVHRTRLPLGQPIIECP